MEPQAPRPKGHPLTSTGPPLTAHTPDDRKLSTSAFRASAPHRPALWRVARWGPDVQERFQRPGLLKLNADALPAFGGQRAVEPGSAQTVPKRKLRNAEESRARLGRWAGRLPSAYGGGRLTF